jgi:hypothetical protein
MKNKQLNYDHLCYATFINIHTLTKGAEEIVLKNFDYDNKEHQFIVAVVAACWSVLGERKVIIETNMFARRMLSKKYKVFGKVKAPNGKEEVFVDVPELLEYMRKPAKDLCGEDFTFGDVYDAYYSGKDE